MIRLIVAFTIRHAHNVNSEDIRSKLKSLYGNQVFDKTFNETVLNENELNEETHKKLENELALTGMKFSVKQITRVKEREQEEEEVKEEEKRQVDEEKRKNIIIEEVQKEPEDRTRLRKYLEKRRKEQNEEREKDSKEAQDDREEIEKDRERYEKSQISFEELTRRGDNRDERRIQRKRRYERRMREKVGDDKIVIAFNEKKDTTEKLNKEIAQEKEREDERQKNIQNADKQIADSFQEKQKERFTQVVNDEKAAAADKKN